MSDLRCTAEGEWGRCDRPQSSRVQGLCYGHLRQVRERGHTYRKVEPRGPKPRKGCEFPGCPRPHGSKGYCDGHAHQIRKGYPLVALVERNPPGTLCTASGSGWTCPEIATPFSPHCLFHRVYKDESGVPKKRVQRTTQTVQVRDVNGNKHCPRCDVWKPEDAFYDAGHTADKKQPHCIDCYLWANTLRNFGLTQEAYGKLLSSQGGGCATCGREPSRNRLSVDHDHSCCPDPGKSCGKCVRGILCSPCNTALGLIEEKESTLTAMSAYLKKWGNND